MKIFIVLFIISTGLYIYERIKSNKKELKQDGHLSELDDYFKKKIDDLDKFRFTLEKEHNIKVYHLQMRIQELEDKLELSKQPIVIEPIIAVDKVTKVKRGRKKSNEVI